MMITSAFRCIVSLVALSGSVAVFACGDSSSTGSGGQTATGSTMSTSSSPTGSTGSPTSTATGLQTTAGTGVGGGVSCNEAGGSIPPLKLTQVVTGLVEPDFVTAAPGDAGKLYVLELDGRILIVENGAVTGTFLDISSSIQQHQGSEEWGLLGLAFHPGYAQNGRFFLYYTSPDLHNRIYEYKRSANDPTKADATPVKTFAIDLSHSAYNHNAGMLAFGPDGMLYASTGDTAIAAGDPSNPAQNPSSNLGKILRIDVDSDSAPAGNLNGYVWDMGFRNPWRFSFDTCKGDMYVADVGRNCFEEVDVEPSGQGNKNYGWSVMEGMHCVGDNCSTPTDPPADCDGTGKTLPVIEHSHSAGWVSITGGYVYRGAAIPGLQGVYLYGDYGARKVFAFRYANGAATAQIELTTDLGSDSLGGISSFGQDEAGNIYIVDIGGAVYRIDAE